jgi:hypothetical protein
MRVLIAGVPRAGKTTFASSFSGEVLHTDDLIETHDWSGASAQAAEWMSRPGARVIEGVAVPRALRKWLAANAEGKPADVVYFLDEPHVNLQHGQIAMAKGCRTVWNEILPELRARGVEVRSSIDGPPMT